VGGAAQAARMARVRTLLRVATAPDSATLLPLGR
jgi:hypothetical protein